MDWNEAKEFCSGLHQSSRLVEPFSKDMIDAIGAIFPYESPVPGGYRPDNYTGLGWIGVYQDAVSVILLMMHHLSGNFSKPKKSTIDYTEMRQLC